MKRRDLLAASAAPVLASFLGTSNAQTAFNFTKPVKFIVPYAPGGLPDTVARVFALRIGQQPQRWPYIFSHRWFYVFHQSAHLQKFGL